MTTTTEGTSLLMQIANDPSYVGRYIEFHEGETLIGPIKKIRVRGNYVNFIAAWTAIEDDTAPGVYRLYSEELDGIGGDAAYVRAYQNEDGSIRISVPMIGSAFIHPAGYEGPEKPDA